MAHHNTTVLADRPAKRRLSTNSDDVPVKKSRGSLDNTAIIDLTKANIRNLTRRTTTAGEEVFVSEDGRRYRHVSPTTEHFLGFNGMTRSLMGDAIWNMIGHELETQGNEAPTHWLVGTCMIHTWGCMSRDMYYDLKSFGALQEEMEIIRSDEDFGFPADEDCVKNELVIEVGEEVNHDLVDEPMAASKGASMESSDSSESSDDEDDGDDDSSGTMPDNYTHENSSTDASSDTSDDTISQATTPESITEDEVDSELSEDEFDVLDYYFGDDELELESELEEIDEASQEQIYAVGTDTDMTDVPTELLALGQAELIAHDAFGDALDEGSELMQMMKEGLEDDSD